MRGNRAVADPPESIPDRSRPNDPAAAGPGGPAFAGVHSGMSYEMLGQEIAALVHASRADEDFKRDLLAYAVGRPAARLVLLRPAPRLKVLRLITQLLHAEPSLCVGQVAVDGVSGCSDFRGRVTVHCDDGSRVWRFRWDCRWRAEEQGMHDGWGLPDQSRAAREFGWRCFAQWEPVPQGERADPSALEQGV